MKTRTHITIGKNTIISLPQVEKTDENKKVEMLVYKIKEEKGKRTLTETSVFLTEENALAIRSLPTLEEMYDSPNYEIVPLGLQQDVFGLSTEPTCYNFNYNVLADLKTDYAEQIKKIKCLVQELIDTCDKAEHEFTNYELKEVYDTLEFVVTLEELKEKYSIGRGIINNQNIKNAFMDVIDRVLYAKAYERVIKEEQTKVGIINVITLATAIAVTTAIFVSVKNNLSSIMNLSQAQQFLIYISPLIINPAIVFWSILSKGKHIDKITSSNSAIDNNKKRINENEQRLAKAIQIYEKEEANINKKQSLNNGISNSNFGVYEENTYPEICLTPQINKYETRFVTPSSCFGLIEGKLGDLTTIQKIKALQDAGDYLKKMRQKDKLNPQSQSRPDRNGHKKKIKLLSRNG